MAIAMCSVALAVFIGTAYVIRGMPSAAGAVAWALCALGTGSPSGNNATKLGPVAMKVLMRSELSAALLLFIAIVSGCIHTTKGVAQGHPEGQQGTRVLVDVELEGEQGG
eukprot:CAMPEP_0180713306 /NCGR_PEP_ID=MMETSP1038_2-20121128/11823_1 /TAXON_ID=632150 /ORGANISM="Azadinium spinosum, Strain 3D9" /LENGTH=109 /DNA_ID=CAMNT_0022745605 /DNA_START=587 /DNA_END=916 /DNA_ORIENTATION=+